jgi:hypothetical protein
MSPSIEQIEAQIAELQATLEKLKNPKLKVSRHFTGQYFAPYQGVQYRRMESEGVPVWESFLDLKREWVTLNPQERKKLEEMYLKDCVSSNQESIENFMN